MPPPLGIAIELLVPMTLAGMPLPAGTIVRLSVDLAMQLLHERRARLASDTPRPIYRR